MEYCGRPGFGSRDLDLAAGHGFEPAEDAQHRGLAAAGRPDDGEEGAFLDVDRHVVDGDQALEALDQVLDPDLDRPLALRRGRHTSGFHRMTQRSTSRSRKVTAKPISAMVNSPTYILGTAKISHALQIM